MLISGNIKINLEVTLRSVQAVLGNVITNILVQKGPNFGGKGAKVQ